jgi:hypothetical protein
MEATPLADRNRARLLVPTEYGYETPDWQQPNR